MRKLWGPLVGAFIICASLGAAHGTVVIKGDPGGLIDNFVTRYEHLAQTGEPVVVAGDCNSACTMMLGILPKSQVCVTPEAAFGFHSGFWSRPDDPQHKNLGYSASATAQLWENYPSNVRHMLRARGWNGHTPHPNLIMVKGTDLYRQCQ